MTPQGKPNLASKVARRLTLAAICMFSTTSTLVAVTGKVEAKTNAKYAVVDMQRVILNVEEGKKARATLKKEIQSKEKELMKKKQELDKLNKDWKSQAALLSEQARMKKQQEFQQRFLELRNAEMTFQQELKRKEQKATQKIAISVARLVEKMAVERKVEAVFETSSAGLLYLKDPLDMTADVIKRYETTSKDKKVAKKEKK